MPVGRMCRPAFFYAKPKSCAAWATIKHITMPVAVGTRKEIQVHFRLCVSFLIVHSVVPQGQWFSEKSIVQTAVSQVQPLFKNNCFISAKLCSSEIEPLDI